MASEIKAPLMPKPLRNICQGLNGSARPQMKKAAQGSLDYYPGDLLMEIITLIGHLSDLNNELSTIKELRALEMWVLSFATHWTIDSTRGTEFDLSKKKETK